jgi:hypothetical protein
MSERELELVAAATPAQLRKALRNVIMWADELAVDIEGNPSMIGGAFAKEILGHVTRALV